MDASPLLSRLALALLAAFVVTTMLAFIDPRLLNGVSVWEKPAKFYLSLAVHAATLNWGLMLLAPSERTAPAIRRTALIAAIAAVGEMIWITLQAARGQASHFNDTAAMYQIMYALMGAGAVTLTGITIYLGFRILTRGKSIATYAAGTGFILAGILTTAVAGYLSQQTGHAVGGDATDASGLPFFHWSTTGGDLRVAHFAALHVAQAIPFLAWIWPDRRIINLGLFASVVIVGALLAQAMAGIPFLRA
jgi:hypothetical protein